MITTTLTRENAHIWSGYFPVVKRLTRKGKVLFTAVDGNGEKTYVSTGAFASTSEFYKSVYRNQLEKKDV